MNLKIAFFAFGIIIIRKCGPQIINLHFILNVTHMELLKPFTSLGVLWPNRLTPVAEQRDSNFS